MLRRRRRRRAQVTLRHVWASPNTVWGAIALAVYVYFPYDLSATGACAACAPPAVLRQDWRSCSQAHVLRLPLCPPAGLAARGPLTSAYFQSRFPLFLAVTFAYTGFWHVALYGLGWASRPFVQGRQYRLTKVRGCAAIAAVAVVRARARAVLPPARAALPLVLAPCRSCTTSSGP